MAEDLEMEGLSPEEQAKRAISHVLKRIRDHEHIGYYMGPFTESFELLTEALASLTGHSVEDLRKAYKPRNPQNPKKDG